MSAPAPGRESPLNRILDAVGRTLITAGVLLLAFVAYQLWGTGIQQAQSQKSLARQYSFLYPNRPSTVTTVPTLPKEGEVVGRIAIPKIGLTTWMVAGARLKDLEKGPGLFAGSVLPGQLGNSAVAGHRTSFGAPFGRLNEVVEGDEIIYTTAWGTFTYTVTKQAIVPATRVDVVKTTDTTKAITTLVTCHPKWTSEKRLIVRAELTATQKPLPATPLATVTWETTEEAFPGWFHDTSRILPTVLWSVVLVAVWLIWRRLRGTGVRRVLVSAVSAAAFIVVLYVVFENLTGLLPANL